MSNNKFEYRIIDHDMLDNSEIETMNYMGENGWEIIRILDPIDYKDSDGKFVRTYYKRKTEQYSGLSHMMPK